MSINTNFNSTILISNYTALQPPASKAKIEKFLKRKDDDCIKAGIDKEVFEYLSEIFEKGGLLWNLETFSRFPIVGTPEQLNNLLLLFTLPGFVFANAEMIETVLFMLQGNITSIGKDILVDPTHLVHEVIEKITHLLVIKLREINKITGNTFILQCGEKINLLGQKEMLFCHFYNHRWHANLFTEFTQIQSNEPLFFAPVNYANSKGIMFNKKGEIVQNSIYLLHVRNLNELDSKNASNLIKAWKHTGLQAQTSAKFNSNDPMKILEDVCSGYKKGHWRINAIVYTPWDPNNFEQSNCLVFKSEYDPVSSNAISFRQDSLSIDEILDLIQVKEAREKITESFSLFKEDFAKALELAPTSTQQIVFDINLLQPPGFEEEIDRLTDRELLQLQYDVLENIVLEETKNPESFSDAIVEIAQEQNVTIEGEVTPLSLAKQMLGSIKEKIQVLEELEPSPVLIAPELQHKDSQARAALESKISVSSKTTDKKKEKKKAYKERKKLEAQKLEAQKKDSKKESEDVQTTQPSINNNNAPKLRNKDKELMSDIQSGKRVKGRVLFKLAMKMVDGVKNVKGSHFSTTVQQSDGSMEGTTIVKKHGGDSVVSSGSAKKTLKKIFALRQKK